MRFVTRPQYGDYKYLPKSLWLSVVLVSTYFYVLVTLRACLHGDESPQVGEVTRGRSPHLSCKHDQIKIRDYMDRWVTSPTWGPPPPCKQALILHTDTERSPGKGKFFISSLVSNSKC